MKILRSLNTFVSAHHRNERVFVWSEGSKARQANTQAVSTSFNWHYGKQHSHRFTLGKRASATRPLNCSIGCLKTTTMPAADLLFAFIKILFRQLAAFHFSSFCILGCIAFCLYVPTLPWHFRSASLPHTFCFPNNLPTYLPVNLVRKQCSITQI